MKGHDHLSEDALLDLVSGLSKDPERDVWLEHVRTCRLCSEALHRHVLARETARANAESSILRLPSPGLSMVRRAADQRRRAVLWAFSSAAAAILAAGLWVAWPKSSVLTAQLKRLPTDVEFTMLRSDSPASPDPHLVSGIRAYARARDGQAVAELELARLGQEEESLRRVYLGSALAFQGRYKRAVDVLRPLKETSIPDPWRSESRWTLCVALYGSGEIDAGDSLANVLSEGDAVARSRAMAIRHAASRDESGP